VVESQPSKLLVAGSIPVSRSRLRRFAGLTLSRVEGASPRPKSRAQFARDLLSGAMRSFEQAAIKIEKRQEFAKLQAAVEQAFLPEKAERFLKQLDRKGIRVRDFDAILAQKMLESVGEPGLNARRLYGSLPVSDQAQMREFYLSKLEKVDVALRHKFKKLYQYY
jgi:hypothetical protein